MLYSAHRLHTRTGFIQLQTSSGSGRKWRPKGQGATRSIKVVIPILLAFFMPLRSALEDRGLPFQSPSSLFRQYCPTCPFEQAPPQIGFDWALNHSSTSPPRRTYNFEPSEWRLKPPSVHVRIRQRPPRMGGKCGQPLLVTSWSVCMRRCR